MSGAASGELKRELGLFDAVLLGLGSILGTGAFVTVPMFAAKARGAIVIAGAVALLNGLSSARLASRFPVSGGTYECGSRTLGSTAGFTAGATFLVAKGASCATAALSLGGLGRQVYGSAVGDRTVITVAGLIALTGATWVTATGVRRSARLNAGLMAVVAAGLTAFVAIGVSFARDRIGVGSYSFIPFEAASFSPAAAAMTFVAFTGYGRIATLGEEVRDPRRTIPAAIVVTLAAVAVVYLAVAWATDVTDATTARPLKWSRHETTVVGLTAAVARGPAGVIVAATVAIAAVAALVGVMLNLVLGLSRVVLAMARRGDLPIYFARVDEDSGSPRRAVWLVGGGVAALTLIGNIETAWTFSAFTVLIYYAITNLACLRLDGVPAWNRATAVLGLLGCSSLAFFIPWDVMAAGAATLAGGFVVRAAVRGVGLRGGPGESPG